MGPRPDPIFWPVHQPRVRWRPIFGSGGRGQNFTSCALLWPPCVADADIIFLPCGFFLRLSFFPPLISVAADWMFTIHLRMVWH